MIITRAYTRHYRDNGQLTAYVEFKDRRSSSGTGRIEGPAYEYHGVPIPEGAQMSALFDRAIAAGFTIEHETW